MKTVSSGKKSWNNDIKAGHAKRLAVKIAVKIALVILCAFLCFIFLFPVVWMVSNSFKTNDQVYAQMASWQTFFPPSWDITTWWVSYTKLFTDFGDFGQSILNSILYCSVTIVMVLLINSLAGYALARFKFPGSKVMTTIILLLMMVPVETSVVPTYIILYYLGLIGEGTAVIGYLIPGFASLFYTYMFRQYFLSMPPEIEEAARLDGCSRIGVFFRMILPCPWTMWRRIVNRQIKWCVVLVHFLHELNRIIRDCIRHISFFLDQFSILYHRSMIICTASHLMSIPVLKTFLWIRTVS